MNGFEETFIKFSEWFMSQVLIDFSKFSFPKIVDVDVFDAFIFHLGKNVLKIKK